MYTSNIKNPIETDLSRENDGYEGTSDTMNPYICTPEECYDEKLDCYCSIIYCRKLASGRNWIFPDNVPDLDEVEVYSSYGSGFWWNAVGSESIKMIDNPLNEYGELDYGVETYGTPDWVNEYAKSLGEDEP